MTQYFLTNLETGEQTTFDKMLEVEKFVGRSGHHVRFCAKRGINLRSSNGNRYDVLIMTTRKPAYAKFTEPQLCEKCKNFAGGCSWSEKFEPVVGWTAVPTVLSSSEGRYVKSYHISGCPQFAEG